MNANVAFEKPSVAVPAARWPVDAFVRVEVAALMRGEPLPAGVCPHAAWRQASAEAARDPLHLEAHVRRVLLACLGDERVLVFDALVDVFLVLGPRGVALRRMLLERARPWLDDESHEFLARHLAGGLSRHDPLPTHGASLLDPGLIGLPVLVRQLQPLPFETASQENAGPPQVFWPPAGGGLGAARPWGHSETVDAVPVETFASP